MRQASWWAVTWVAAMAGCDPQPGAGECTPATLDDIGQVRGAYYECLDAQLGGCGPGGYPLGYGAFYAERYLVEIRPEVSASGQAFLDEVSVCLQQQMAAFVGDDSTCQGVWDHGFDSHPDCYVQSGFCLVDLNSQLRIAGAVEPADQQLSEQQAQVVAVAEACAGLE